LSVPPFVVETGLTRAISGYSGLCGRGRVVLSFVVIFRMRGCALVNCEHARLGTLRHAGYANRLAFGPDGTTLAAAGSTGAILLWNMRSRRLVALALSGHAGALTSVAFSPDGKTLVGAGSNGTIGLWDMTNRQPLGPPLIRHKGQALSVAFRRSRSSST
jgi:WD40 repeat protein